MAHRAAFHPQRLHCPNPIPTCHLRARRALCSSPTHPHAPPPGEGVLPEFPHRSVADASTVATRCDSQNDSTEPLSTEPLSTEEIQLIESVAHETMTKLDYKLHLITDENPPTVFTPADLAEFQWLNEERIKEMNSKLLEEDPDDFHRRVYQAEILSLTSAARHAHRP